MSKRTIPQADILSQELYCEREQWNSAVRALRIGSVYAEIYPSPEGDKWRAQRPPILKVVHPKHGEIQLFCPTPSRPYPSTYGPDQARKEAALLAALDELTSYLQAWVRDFET